MSNDYALSGSVRPLLASISITFGLALGACGGSGGEGADLEPALGRGNAADIRAEYEAALQGRHPDVKQVEAADTAVGGSLAVTTRSEAIQHAQRFHVLARQVVEQVNELRSRPQRCGDTSYPAVGPLVWNARVAYAALLESEWMVARNEFSHAWEDGKYVWDRFDMAQYAWKKADENIAAGFRSLDEAMRAWLDSPSHCKAMMRADIREIGLSVLPGQPGNRYRSYWTMALGSSH